MVAPEQTSMTFLDRYLARARITRALAHVPPGSRVLDIGCFEGQLFSIGAARGISGVGLDPELDAEKTLPNAQLYPDAFPSARVREQFDCVTALAVLEHIPQEALREFVAACRDALRPGGIVVLTVPSPIVDRILSVLVFLRLVNGMSLEQHHGFDVSLTPQLFQNAGLTMVKHEPFQLGVNNLFVFRRES